jgi:hypothetical protein
LNSFKLDLLTVLTVIVVVGVIVTMNIGTANGGEKHANLVEKALGNKKIALIVSRP